jgi:hypothetical protein
MLELTIAGTIELGKHAPSLRNNAWPLLAQSVNLRGARPCPELGAKPTCQLHARTSQFDPNRTSSGMSGRFHMAHKPVRCPLMLGGGDETSAIYRSCGWSNDVGSWRECAASHWRSPDRSPDTVLAHRNLSLEQGIAVGFVTLDGSRARISRSSIDMPRAGRIVFPDSPPILFDKRSTSSSRR